MPSPESIQRTTTKRLLGIPKGNRPKILGQHDSEIEDNVKWNIYSLFFADMLSALPNIMCKEVFISLKTCEVEMQINFPLHKQNLKYTSCDFL